MAQGSSAPLQEVFQRAERGDAEAREALFALLYDELHRLAHANVARARGAITWNTTTLLHEAYLGFARREGLQFPDENRFLGYAARAMRGLVIDAIRSRYTEKRGSEMTFVPVADRCRPPWARPKRWSGLATPSRISPGSSRHWPSSSTSPSSAVSRFTEIAAIRGVTERTVQRDWAKARLLLHGALDRT